MCTQHTHTPNQLDKSRLLLLNLHNKAHLTTMAFDLHPVEFLPHRKSYLTCLPRFVPFILFILHPCASLLLLPPHLYHTLTLWVLLCIVYDLLIGPQACRPKERERLRRQKLLFSSLSPSPPLSPSPRRQKYVG